ncbi:hypothetical protein J2Z21_001300 [Streptomyces griseochromogenes]|uniref:NAD-dependent epimerase/dehydratase domain-containing protein n=2 Tax=Streptomyces griseochromogenes TaxID=68214 RepID=A0ABS4LME6_9ACTN|nr:NAD-dependent epimerase/dehydratase family protein [Streptomyces griseochromogenes]MBP2048376.1 hypothetical protein [Streptomyces griseochromogenes]
MKSALRRPSDHCRHGAGSSVFYGDTDKRWSWVHVDDLADAYVRILDNPAAVDGETFVIADEQRLKALRRAARGRPCRRQTEPIGAGARSGSPRRLPVGGGDGGGRCGLPPSRARRRPAARSDRGGVPSGRDIRGLPNRQGMAGLAATTLNQLVQPVIEVCTFYGVLPWELSSRPLDQYFAGPGRRGHTTIRKKITSVDQYFAFLEQRYADEILRRFGAAVESPVDAFNRPRHRGDFGLRIPPSRTEMKAFFTSWRQELCSARKYPVAVRNYVMAKTAYISGVRATELCLVRLGDLHWDNGQWGPLPGAGQGGSRLGAARAGGIHVRRGP